MPQVKFYEHKEATLPKWAREKLERYRQEILDLRSKNAELVRHVEKCLLEEVAAVRDLHDHGRVLTPQERKKNKEFNELMNSILQSFSKK